MKVVLNTTHLGNIGGGENYTMRLAQAIAKHAELYVTRNWSPDFVKYNGFGQKFEEYNGLFKPDIFVHSSHFVSYPAIGRRNWIVSFFPKKHLVHTGYDGAISICRYTAEWVERYWNLFGRVIEPCIDPSVYRKGRKGTKIVSIGHFFEEPDGHSKNQHILAEAFDGLEGYELVFIGNAGPGDEAYLAKLRKASQGKKIRIEVNKDYEFLKNELSGASHLWHANGYGRTDPEQTEHFGIVILEALACGVVPIVHNSGGAREICGITWDKPEELPKLTRKHTEAPPLRGEFMVEFFEEEVRKWLESERSTLGAETTTAPPPKKWNGLM